jgi:hypothetical protein
MRKNKVCTFYLKTFRKLQEFLEDRTEEELNREKSDPKEIEKLIALQDYIAKSAIIDCKEDTATIDLSIKDYEFIFTELLYPALFYYDSERLYYKLRDLVDGYKELIENVIAENDYLERYSDYQNILIKNQKQLIEELTDKLLEEETD